jgi:hypothetical protein
VLPGPKVQVEAWFSARDVPKGAKVEVVDAEGKPLLSEPGVLDAEGIFVFPVERPQPLTIVISAGAGHNATLTISKEELLSPGAPMPHGSPESSPRPMPQSDRSSDINMHDILLGVALILAAGAFYLSLRCLAHLRRLERYESRPNRREERPAGENPATKA